MTIATPITALDTFRAISQYHPWHFWGVAGGSGPASVTRASTSQNNCRPVLRQYSWQTQNAVAREEIAQALWDAEQLVKSQLDYPIGPEFIESEMDIPRYFDPLMIGPISVGSDGRWQAIQLPHGRIQAVGVEAITLLSTPVIDPPFPFTPGTLNALGTIAYYDRDGDGLVDQAQIRFTDSATPLDQFAVYVPAGTGDGTNGRFDFTDLAERWRIFPVQASRSGTTVTLLAPAWLFIRPVLYEGVPSSVIALNGLDPTVSTNYLQSVDVCTRVCDPNGTSVATAQAELIWEASPWPWCACPSGGSDPAGTASAIGRVGIRSAEVGIVSAVESVYDSTAGTWAAADCGTWWNCRPPDRVIVRYMAGSHLVRGQVAPPWDRLIVGMAAAMLGRQLPGCMDYNSLITRWQTDPTRAGGGETFQAQPRANNPWGTRFGQIEAWAQTQRDRLLRGVAV